MTGGNEARRIQASTLALVLALALAAVPPYSMRLKSIQRHRRSRAWTSIRMVDTP